MRKSLLLLTVLGTSLLQPARAEKPNSSGSGIEFALAEVPSGESSSQDIQLTGGTEDRSAYWRPGLLGQRYVETRYIHLNVKNDGFVELFDDTIQGVDGTLNLPIPGIRESTGFLGIDAFGGYRHLSLSGNHYFPPPDDIQAGIDVDQNTTFVGASIYLDHANFGPLRPFVQLGAEFHNMENRITMNGTVTKETDDDTDLLVVPGIEVDFWDWMAIRASVDVETEEMDHSTLFGDIILWPWESVFIRGGFVVPFDGGGNGGTIGAGLVF